MHGISNAEHATFLPCLSNLVIDVPSERRQDLDRNIWVADHLVESGLDLRLGRINNFAIFLSWICVDEAVSLWLA